MLKHLPGDTYSAAVTEEGGSDLMPAYTTRQDCRRITVHKGSELLLGVQRKTMLVLSSFAVARTPFPLRSSRYLTVY